jgi:hypothetical protein
VLRLRGLLLKRPHNPASLRKIHAPVKGHTHKIS